MDQESFKTNSNPSPVADKESDWKNILAIVFLVAMPFVGVILMWLLASWRKKTKVIITIILGIPVILALLGIIVAIILISFGGAKEKAKDAIVMSNLNQLRSAIEVSYWNKEGGFSGISCSSPELSVICNNIKGSGVDNPIIKSSVGDYCFYVRLSNGKYYCADNVRESTYGGTTVFPGGTGYCDGTTFKCP